jgi:23S rRNA pseudouridine1911/1915/1917 synthase
VTSRRRSPAAASGQPAGGDRWTHHRVTEAEAGSTLQEILTGALGVSRRMIQKLTRASGIRLNGHPAYLKRKVRAGDDVAARLVFDEEPGLEPMEMALSVCYEDEHLLVVDKPAGILVHPVGRSGEATLAHGIAAYLLRAGVRARVRPVHRLDRDTSGLVLFAKSAFVHQVLDRQLREREVRRAYLAFVAGVPTPSEQTIDAQIGRHPRDPNLRAVVARGGDAAVTRFRVLEQFSGVSLLDVELETGRTHQIRVHLSHAGHPLIGDVRYGGPRGALGRQALHAARLGFVHPKTHDSIELSSELPADLARLREDLRRGRPAD